MLEIVVNNEQLDIDGAITFEEKTNFFENNAEISSIGYNVSLPPTDRNNRLLDFLSNPAITGIYARRKPSQIKLGSIVYKSGELLNLSSQSKKNYQAAFYSGASLFPDFKKKLSEVFENELIELPRSSWNYFELTPAYSEGDYVKLSAIETTTSTSYDIPRVYRSPIVTNNWQFCQDICSAINAVSGLNTCIYAMPRQTDNKIVVFVAKGKAVSFSFSDTVLSVVQPIAGNQPLPSEGYYSGTNKQVTWRMPYPANASDVYCFVSTYNGITVKWIWSPFAQSLSDPSKQFQMAKLEELVTKSVYSGSYKTFTNTDLSVATLNSSFPLFTDKEIALVRVTGGNWYQSVDYEQIITLQFKLLTGDTGQNPSITFPSSINAVSVSQSTDISYDYLGTSDNKFVTYQKDNKIFFPVHRLNNGMFANAWNVDTEKFWHPWFAYDNIDGLLTTKASDGFPLRPWFSIRWLITRFFEMNGWGVGGDFFTASDILPPLLYCEKPLDNFKDFLSTSQVSTTIKRYLNVGDYDVYVGKYMPDYTFQELLESIKGLNVTFDLDESTKTFNINYRSEILKDYTNEDITTKVISEPLLKGKEYYGFTIIQENFSDPELETATNLVYNYDVVDGAQDQIKILFAPLIQKNWASIGAIGSAVRVPTITTSNEVGLRFASWGGLRPALDNASKSYPYATSDRFSSDGTTAITKFGYDAQSIGEILWEDFFLFKKNTVECWVNIQPELYNLITTKVLSKKMINNTLYIVSEKHFEADKSFIRNIELVLYRLRIY